MIKEFMEFLRQYNVFGLAIAVIIGGKLNALVSSFVNDFLAPLIFNPMLSALGLKNIEELSWRGIFYGKLVSSVIDFVIVAFIVFLMIRWLNRVTKSVKKEG